MNIFIMDSIHSFNRGEAAILYGMLEAFKFLGKTDLTILSNFPDDDQKFYGKGVTVLPNWFNFRGEYVLSNKAQSRFKRLLSGVSFYARLVLYPVLFKIIGNFFLSIIKSKHWKTFLEADLLISGHDNFFSNGVPTYFMVMTFVARYILKTPIIIYGASISPSAGKKRKRALITKLSLNNLDLITLREDQSFAKLRKIGVVNPNMKVTADLAFLMKPCADNRVTEIFSNEGIVRKNHPLIGIGFSKSVLHRAFKFDGNLDRVKDYKDYISNMAAFIDYLVDKLSARVVLVSHTVGPVSFIDDRIIARDCYQAVTNKENVIFIKNEYTPQELKGLIACFDVFIGSRTHSLIAAGSMLVPSIVIALSDMAKVKGILGQMLGLEPWFIDVREMNYDKLVRKFCSLWEQRQQIRIQLQKKMSVMKQRNLRNIELLKQIMKQD